MPMRRVIADDIGMESKARSETANSPNSLF